MSFDLEDGFSEVDEMQGKLQEVAEALKCAAISESVKDFEANLKDAFEGTQSLAASMLRVQLLLSRSGKR